MLQEQAKLAVTEEEIPKSLRNRPVLDQFESPYWFAYQELAGSRQFTPGGAADIPYTQKVAWLDENGIDDQDDRNDYMQIITAIDASYLEYYYEKSKVK